MSGDLRSFPAARSSFDFPVIPPTDDPDVAPLYCVQFSEAYLPYVLGALFQLTQETTFETANDADKILALQRMDTLISAFVDGTDCMSALMFAACDSPDCGIKYSTDGGSTWTCIDLASCIETIWDEKLAQAFDDGVLGQKGTQQGPGPEPPFGGCNSYHVVLSPGATWHSPSPVNDKYTINITNVKGGWSIGELAWYCGDGARYLLGTCDEGLKTHVTGDPINPGAYHMAVIGQLVGGAYFDPLTGVYTVPDGTGETDFVLLANTDLTGAPSGEVEFDVQVCVPAWCFHFDLNSGLDNWNPWFGGSWNGSAWEATDHSNFLVITIEQPSSMSSTFIHSVQIYGVKNGSGGGQATELGWYDARNFKAGVGQGLGGYEHTFIVDQNCTAISVTSGEYPQGQTPDTITDIYITGMGVCPYGDPNC